ncbi:MAG: MBL fold metallo-hydrolase [Vicinamibacterales bacterium]
MRATLRVHVRLVVWSCLTLSAAIALAVGPGATAAAVQTTTPPGGATARYLGNAAVLVADGSTSVAFDPLFRNDFGTYERVPDAIERALFAGAPPFDGLDAVFVSHHHEDHFSAADVLRLLEVRPGLRLYAPAQAVAGMRALAPDRLAAVLDRVTAVALDYGDAPITVQHGALLIEAVRVPHSGWPARQQQVENLAFRVTLGGATTVVHLGDADANDAHFAGDGAFWGRRRTHLALPPYWFFLTPAGRQVLERRTAATHSIGVHVPAEVPSRPADRAPELRPHELFTEPGDVRTIR